MYITHYTYILKNNRNIIIYEICTCIQSIYNTYKMYQEILKNIWMSFSALLKQSETEVKGRADNLTGTLEKSNGKKDHTTMGILFSGGVQDYHFQVDKDHVSSTLL